MDNTGLHRESHKRGSGFAVATCVLLLIHGVSAPAFAQQLPTGGTVAAGNAGISQNGSTLNINQSTNQAIINWQSFSVGQGGTVNFNQPSAAASTLNRVLGTTPSSIAGTINAPGTVLLVNPNGIAITSTGVVNVGGFAASTLNIKDEDYLAGRFQFTGNGGSAAVSNAGRINVSDGGFAALLGGQVANSGVISARLGKVGLGAGEMVTLDFAGDGFLSVAVPSSQIGNLVDGSGALVTNSGKIRANGGQVYLSAATAANILRDAVNVPGTIRTNSVGTRAGKIVINGGTGNVNVSGRLAANGGKRAPGGSIAVSGGSVATSGKLSASGKTGGSISVAASKDLSVSGTVAAKGRDGQGGRIDLAGTNIALVEAVIDSSGVTEGGLVRIGGTFQGGNGDPTDPLYIASIGRFGALPAIASAQTVTIDAGSRIDVSARRRGDGGTVIVWSEQYTSFAGSISGTGGSAGGNGAFAEVSGHDFLDFTGVVDLLGTGGGSSGTLLLDPRNVTIQTTGTNSVTCTGGTCTPSQNSAILLVSTLTSALASSNVVVNTNGGTSAQAGTITVLNDITWTSGRTLTLQAASSIIISANIYATSNGTAGGTANGGLTINSTGNASVSASGGIVVANFTLTRGQWTQNSATLPTFTAATNFTVNTSNGATFLRVLGGDGLSTATAYRIADVYGLQGMNGTSGNFVLANNIDASGTATWNSNKGFVPIAELYGDFNGNNYTISGLRIVFNGTYINGTGLFDTIASGSTVRDLNLSGGTVTSGTWTDGTTGALAGANQGTISNVTSSVAVGGRGSSMGGLVGYNLGTITNSSSSGAVTGADGTDNANYTYSAGGLVGANTGTISFSYATGAVLGNQYVGGLVGSHSYGTVSDSYATGSVTGYYNYVGGLVGNSTSATITRSYATGTVTNTGSGATNNPYFVGGLVGGMSGGSLSYSYASGAVNAINAAAIGGLVGGTSNGASINDSYSTSPVSGSIYVGGLVGWLDSGTTMTAAYAANALTVSAGISGGVVGYNSGGAMSFVYWNRTTFGSGPAVGSGSSTGTTGLTTTQLQSGLPAGFSSAVWASVSNNYPLLLWQPGFVAGVVYANYGGAAVGSATVSILVNGVLVSTATTDASGAYSVYLGPTGISAGSDILAYTSGGVSFLHTSGTSASGLNVYGGYLSQTSTNATSSGLAAEMANATAGNSAVLSQIAGLSNIAITSTGTTFAINSALGSGTLGTLVLTASGTVTQTTSIVATNLLLQGSGASYALNNSGNNVATLAGSVGTGSIAYNNGANDLSIGAVAGTNGITAAALTLAATGTVSQTQAIKALSGGLTLALQGAGGTFNLTNASNSVTDLTANTGSINLTSNVALAFGASTLGGNLSVNVTTGSMTQYDVLTVAGTSSFATAANNATISLTQANLLTGAVSLSTTGASADASLTNGRATTLAASSIGRNLTVRVTSGGLSQSGILTVGGTSSFTTTASGASINLSTSINQLTGAVTLGTTGSAGSASLINGRAIAFAASTIGGNLSATATSGNISQSGALTVAGTSSFTTSAANATITLNTTTNSFAGAVSLNTSGTGNASFTNNRATLLGASSIGGALTVTSRAGNLTQNGVLTVGGASSFTTSASNATITLNSDNAITGAITFTTAGASGNVSIKNAQATVLGASTAGGTLSVTSTDSLAINGAVAAASTITLVSGADLTIGSLGRVQKTGNNANGVVLAASAGSFINNRGSDAITVAGTGRWLVYSAGPDNNVFGGLNSNNTAIWNTTYPTAVAATGNRYVFAAAPVLTVTTTGTLTKTYGDDASSAVANSSYTVSGVQAGVVNAFLGDSQAAVLSGVTLSSTGSGVNANVSAYAITASATVSGGYTVSYVNNGVLTVTPATLTATGNAASRTYGDANPALSGSITGFKNGQSEATFGGGVWSTAADTSTGVGNYAISGALANASPNYVLVQAVANATALTVTPRAITVTADAQSRVYGDANPALSHQVTTGNLVNGDTLSGALATGANGTSGVGNYAITQSTLAASANYTLTYVGADLTVTPRAITVTADAQSRVYGDANPALSYQVTTGNLVNGDTLSGTLATGANGTSGVGAYAITQNTLTASANYTLTYVGADLTVTPRAITVTADAQSRVYGEANPALSYQITSGNLVNNDTLSGVLATIADGNSPAGAYAITQNTLAGGPNYTLTYVGADLTVTPAPIDPPGAPSTGNNPSTFNPQTPANPVQTVSITFETQGARVFNISFTPPAARTAGTNDVVTASGGNGGGPGGSSGRTYPPISQFDANQYSDFKLPDFAKDAGQAAIFVMLARAADPENAASHMIDKFWNNSAPVWAAPGTLAGRITFTDDAGNPVAPVGNAGRPVIPGVTDIAGLLKTGPVMISGGQPARWLLATAISADGKGIVANDPATGKQVLLTYDAAAKSIGGLVGTFEGGRLNPVASSDAGNLVSELQGFNATGFIAVIVR
ncbi:MAG TPA: MBG domain-containing protein [Pseudolabrys sp.]|nr:MBG domain-containing protein [Pseudolabrys sp.]